MEEKDLIRLIDMLYMQISEAKNSAFSSDNCVINRDEALDIIDEIRTKLPIEVKNAKKLIDARDDFISKAKEEGNRIINNAKGESDKIIHSANEAAKDIVSESEIIATARKKASEIIHRAEGRSKELYRVTNAYTDDALRRIEEAVADALEEIRQSRISFRQASQDKMIEQQDSLDSSENENESSS